ncbi:DUF748 domain-containing protein [Vogesella sp. LIG4]|uniref:DUF748 domain-containing protein n=1 Tax=Vogesella sp. LIG4 TaxID=1192162 RepID=UPI00081FDA3D|nr:DUF748 domain-containing protein [Vogesella sp. LIG4]SCK05080.1 Uncharacterized protein involved in outer membrane biogenesis [Vogesella sp. LIG4]
MNDTDAPKPPLTRSRWPRRLAWAAGGIAVLMAGLWAGVPKAVDYAAGNWAQKVGRKLTLGKVEFAPWALRLTLHDVALRDRDGSNMFSAARLNVDAEGLPLLIGRFQFSDISLDAPHVWAARDSQGVWNWSRLVQDASGPPQPKEEKPSQPPKLLIRMLALNKGQVHVQDALAGNLQRQVLPLDFHLQNLSTLPQNQGRYQLAAELDDGTRLAWQGSLLLQPVQSDGVLKVDGLTLKGIWPYVHPYLQLDAPQGKLALNLPYHFDLAGFSASVWSRNFSARLDGLALAAPKTGSPFKLASLTVSDGQFALIGKQLKLGKVTLAGGEFATVLDGSNQPDWLAALPPAPAATVPAASKPAAKAEPGWQVSVPQLRLENWQLGATHRGFAAPLAARLKLDSLQAGINLDAKGALKVNAATLALSQLAVASGSQQPFARLGSLQLASSELDLAAHRITPGDISLQGLQLAANRDRQGRIDVLEALRQTSGSGKPAAAAASDSAAPTWQLRYPSVTLAGGDIGWKDATTSTPVALQLTDLAAKASGDPQQGWALQFGGALGKGKLQLDATAAANLQDIKGKLQSSGLPLQGVAPYALDSTVLRFGGGELSTDLGFAVNGKRWQADGKAALNRLALFEPGRREPLLGWQQLAISGIKAQPERVAIGDVRLVAPQLRLILDEKRVPNFAHLMKPAPATAKPVAASKPAAASAAPVVDVRAIRVRDARMDFADMGMQPSFGTRIHSLSGTVLGLSSKPGRRGTVTLDGRVDQFGDVRIRGALSPFEVTRDLDMTLSFRNIPLGSLNPYSINFAGWQITDGRLTTDLRYLLKDRQLNGDNRVVIDHIQLGNEVPNYQGTRLPLRLAVALLEDSDGRIDLALPVAGSLDQPDFSYGHLVWQAFRNILTKIVTAPFRALFGGQGFDAIYTDAGDARIPPPEREKLGKLADLMLKRPKLALAIGGGYDPELDSRELARYRVDSDILKRAAYQLQPDEPLPLPDMGDPAIRKAVGDVYAAQLGRFAWLKRVATEKDTAERAQAMRKELLAAQKVDQAALAALAKARGEAARKLLLQDKPELEARVSVQEPDKVKAEKDGVPLLVKLK